MMAALLLTALLDGATGAVVKYRFEGIITDAPAGTLSPRVPFAGRWRVDHGQDGVDYLKEAPDWTARLFEWSLFEIGIGGLLLQSRSAMDVTEAGSVVKD